VHVDRGKCLVKCEHPRDHHEHRAHERSCRPVNANARYLAQADEDVGDDEDDERGDHEGHFNMNRHESSSLVCAERDCRSPRNSLYYGKEDNKEF